MDTLPADFSSAGLFRFLDWISRDPDGVQRKVLAAILKQNHGCDFLARHGLCSGESSREEFKSRLPVIQYEEIKNDIDRIVEGDRSPVLCVPPVDELFTSSGTSGGARKLFPAIACDKSRRNVNDFIAIAILDRVVPGLHQGKALYLFTIRKSWKTKGGLEAHTTLTRSFRDIFAPGVENVYTATVSSPGAVFLCPEDKNQVIYCHLLCALLQREAVVRVRAIFASFLVRAFRFLAGAWRLMCDDIRHGTLNPLVRDPTVRAAVEKMLQPNPRLAAEVEAIMCAESERGECEPLIPRLFPNAKIVEAITSGSMAAYIPIIQHLAGKLPIISMPYGASEGYFGLNLEPLCCPWKLQYTILPFLNYFEFIPLERDPESDALCGDVEKIVDLADVVLGQEYELVVTTFAGLYRYRVGDILRVTGFYNLCPKFEFVGRRNVVLSIDTDKTEEAELHTAITRSLEPLLAYLRRQDLRVALLEYSSFADITSDPGHYVLFLELGELPEPLFPHPPAAEPSGCGSKKELEAAPFEQFCLDVESKLGWIYRRNRNEGSIGNLELRVVQMGGFDVLAEAAVARGVEIGQYKTPRCLKSGSDLLALNSRLLSPTIFSPATPL